MDYIKRSRLEIEILDHLSEPGHFHQDIEVLYVLEGSLKLFVGHQEIFLRENDIYVINANKIHSLCSEAPVLLIKLSITYRLISDVFVNEPLLFLCDSTAESGDKYQRLRACMNQLLRFYLDNQGNSASFRYIALGYEVLDCLTSDFLVREPKKAVDIYEKIDERLDEINNYIRANYSQSLSLRELSKRLYLSEGYLSRFFKKNYGMSFSEYLTNVRMHHAMEDLIYTDIPITKIVYSNGFSNQTVFGKIFKALYGTTPSVFRKNARQTRGNPIDTQLERQLCTRLREHLDDAPLQAAPKEWSSLSLSCIATEYDKSPRRCFKTINIGMAGDLIRSEVQEHVILMKKVFGLEYVRFCNVFAPELLIHPGKNVSELNFSKLDRIFDFLQEYKLKPHIELGMKPRRLMRDLVSPVDSAGSSAGPTESTMAMADWAKAVNDLLNHWSKRYGDAIDSWRLELWYPEMAWEQRQPMAVYFSMFNKLYETVRKYSDTLEVGGCGLKFDYLESHMLSFLEQWRRQEIQPDFISALYYAYERGTAITDQSFRRSTDAGHLTKCVDKLAELVRAAGMDGCKVYFSEWNLTVSDRNYINDTCFKGAYVVKNLLDVYGRLDDIAYYLGSDCVTEHYDSGELLFGGTGLVSRDGILKPSGYGCHFLSLLYPYKVLKDGQCLLTTNGRGSYRMVCHNLSGLNSQYYCIGEDKIKKEAVDSCFSKTGGLKLHVELKGMARGLYRQKIYRVNEEKGSIFNLWKAMGYEKNLSAEDIAYLKGSSSPQMTVSRVESVSDSFFVDMELKPNEIAFVQLSLAD